MTTIIQTAAQFKLRIFSYFLATFFPACSAVLMAGMKEGKVDGLVWFLAIGAGLAAFGGALKALFDQNIDTSQKL